MNFKRLMATVLILAVVIGILPITASAASLKLVSGDKGDAVKAVQAVLKNEGFYSGRIDGSYGSDTVAAVKAYQKANSLTQDGKCGTKTLTKMGLISTDPVISSAKTTAALRLRRGPSTTHQEYFVMAKGTAISIIEESGDWYKVRTAEGIEGYSSKNYIKADNISTEPDTGIYEGKVSGIINYLNVRKEATSDSESIAKLTNGTFVYVLKVEGSWVSIQTKSGIKGYAHIKYISISEKQTNITDTTVDIPSYTLKRGMDNTDVKEMQERLKELGFFDGTCTGYYGTVTYKAVLNFQKANSLKADGVAGEKTLTKLYSKDVSGNGGGVGGDDELLYDIPKKPLKQGMDNDDVETMQQRLKDLLYFEGTCTGFFGTKTLKAVKEFQKKNGLTADGIAGAKTLGVMYTTSAITGELSEDEKLKLKIENMIEHAKGYLGAKYVRGGNGPKSFDCSGLTTTVFREAMGYTMTRTAYTQGYNNFGRVIKNMAELKKGDLVFFNTNANDSDLCDHVGIYIGNNEFIHASSSEGKVIISDITKRWWKEIFSWGKRVFE
ncbi:MAG: peptidoglycan-binding protein [Clostridia bacterium]|nr:peptidoglycan-binding protein [Clostridia bacterium]